MQIILLFILLTICTPISTIINLREFQADLNKHQELTQVPSKVIKYQSLKECIIQANKILKDEYAKLRALPEKDISQTIYNNSNFTPFVNKRELELSSSLYFWGDLHGSAHAFMRSILQLVDQNILSNDGKLTNKDSYLIFLGDFVDRGMYGAEVLYIICNLYIENPKQVMIVRGNHEDINLNLLNTQASFIHELNLKYYDDNSYELTSLISILNNFYNSLPVATFIGYDNVDDQKQFLQACHGGLEIGFNAHELLNNPYDYQFIKTLERKNNIELLEKTIQDALYKNIPMSARLNYDKSQLYAAGVGFMWSDFCTDNDTIASYTPYRGWCYGRELTIKLLMIQSSDKAKITMIIRGHQHYGLLLKKLIENGGHHSLYENVVHTVFSAPAILNIHNATSNYLQLDVAGIKK